MKTFIIVFIALAVNIASSPARAANFSLYDATQDNNVPDAQSIYIHRSIQLIPAGTATHVTQGTNAFTRIDTTPSNNTMLGYYSVAFDLNRSQGVQIDFRLRINTELNSFLNRGPFDIVFNSSDDRLIRFYFTKDEIFSVDSNLARDDVVDFDTTSFIDYTLSITDENYILYANASPILSGVLLSSTYGYSYIGFGDRTTGASGQVDFASMSVYGDGVVLASSTTVPEPLSCILFAVSALPLFIRKKLSKNLGS